jgi:hypothetical protein
MRTSIKEVESARHLLEGEFARTQRVWNDAASQNFRSRYYDPAMRLFMNYCRAAEELSSALDDAESEILRR